MFDGEEERRLMENKVRYFVNLLESVFFSLSEVSMGSPALPLLPGEGRRRWGESC